jgi:glycogen operon protein
VHGSEPLRKNGFLRFNELYNFPLILHKEVRMDVSKVGQGSAFPLGMTPNDDGTVNVSVYVGDHAREVDLCIFEQPHFELESTRIRLEDRTDNPKGAAGRIFHGCVSGVPDLLNYGFRVEGPWDPKGGQRYNHQKMLLDPYARAIRPQTWGAPLWSHDRESGDDLILCPLDNAGLAPRSVFFRDFEALTGFDWEGDTHPKNPWRSTRIYEVHVRGATMLRMDVDPLQRGTYRAMACDGFIEHLKKRQVSAVQLMPIFASVPPRRDRLRFWRYDHLSFFALSPAYAQGSNPLAPLYEFMEMVKKFHRHGIEVIVDVVYNHTVEGNHLGPSLSWKGLANSDYYRLCGNDENGGYRYYWDGATGCGNAFNLATPMSAQMVIDSLVYLHKVLHVDGFRFDLATALLRGMGHEVDSSFSFFKEICKHPDLHDCKLIIEPWDNEHSDNPAMEGYRVGEFPPPTRELNGKYRDAMRRFWRGDSGMLPEFATRISGSRDLYPLNPRGRSASINMGICHDGPSLMDWAMYSGHDGLFMDNCGHEGPSDDEAINLLRYRRVKAFHACNLLAHGVPFTLYGDEFAHSQCGNTNTYDRDGVENYRDWSLLEQDRNRLLCELDEKLATLKFNTPALRHWTFSRRSSRRRKSGQAQLSLSWFKPEDGSALSEADWNDPERRTLGVYLKRKLRNSQAKGQKVVLLFNASQHACQCKLPRSLWSFTSAWHRKLDTALDQPFEVASINREDTYVLDAPGVALFFDVA